jgi:hypothetical protein
MALLPAAASDPAARCLTGQVPFVRDSDIAVVFAHACIRSTLHGAFVRGYDATLVSDAHTVEDWTQWGAPTPDVIIAHTNLYWGSETAPGRVAGTVETKDVDFGSAA